MTGMFLLVAVGVIVVRGMMTRTDVYGAFLEGAESGARAAVRLLPPLCGMLLMLKMVTSSGAMSLLTQLLTPVTDMLNMPEEVVPLVLLRPLTGSGSLAALQEILLVCGVDSRAGRLASALMGSSETIIYTLTVYAGAAGVRRVPGALAASLVGYAAGVCVCLLLIR